MPQRHSLSFAAVISLRYWYSDAHIYNWMCILCENTSSRVIALINYSNIKRKRNRSCLIFHYSDWLGRPLCCGVLFSSHFTGLHFFFSLLKPSLLRSIPNKLAWPDENSNITSCPWVNNIKCLSNANCQVALHVSQTAKLSHFQKLSFEQIHTGSVHALLDDSELRLSD